MENRSLKAVILMFILFTSFIFQVFQPVSVLGEGLSNASSSLIRLNLDNNSTEIYLNGISGDDSNDGSTRETAVKTFEKARQLAASYPNVNTIYVTGTVTVSGDISLEGTNAVLKRYSSFNGYLLKVAAGSTATLINITVDGNSAQTTSASGSLIICSGTLNITEGTVLQNNRLASANRRTTNKGGAVFCQGSSCTVNMTGGLVQNNSAMWGGGIYLTEGAVFNMSGGTISNNQAISGPDRWSDWSVSGAGGGICIFEGGTCNLSDSALIQNNSSEEVGGGVSVGTISASLYHSNRMFMNGGTIDGNTAGATGGGIFIQATYNQLVHNLESTATITAGHITNNRMTNTGITYSTFGGGGIYVNGYDAEGFGNGKLILMNAIVTDNTARYQGGGYAACPISDTRIYLSDSGAIYGNKGSYAEDIFIYSGRQGMGAHGGNPEYLISDSMLGCTPYIWKDRYGNEIPLNELKGQLLGEGVALCLHTDQVASEITLRLARVFITGNYSATRGGGIGTNGDVIFGFYEEVFDLTVIKLWDDDNDASGIRPETIEVELWRKTKGIEEEPVYVGYETVIPDADGNWSVTFTGLHKMDGLGNEFEYIVRERAVAGYVTSVVQKTVESVEITNTIATKTISIEGKKIWIDEENRYSQRPESITIRLLENENEIDSITVTEADGWVWKFENLPKYKNGELIVYTIIEDEIAGYISEVQGYDITNTYQPPTVPETGDNFNPVLWITVMIVSLASIVALVWYQYKNQRKNSRKQ